MAYDRKPPPTPARKAVTREVKQDSSPAETGPPPGGLTDEQRAQVADLLARAPALGDLETYDRVVFAGAARRLWAFILDCIIVMPTLMIVAWVLGTFPGQQEAAAGGVGLFGLSQGTAKTLHKIIQLVLYDTYFTACLHRWGATWGMKFSGIVALGRDLALPSKGQARGRYWAALLSTLAFGLGYLAILWDRRRRAWHDRMVGTYVVKADKVPRFLIDYASPHTRPKKETLEESDTMEVLLWLLMVVLFLPGVSVVYVCSRVVAKLKPKPAAQA